MKTIICFILLLTTGISFDSDASWKSQASVFAEVAVKTKVDVRELAAIAALESSFRPDVSASTSTAVGLFQFTNRTWRVTLASYGEQYGLTSKAKRTDPMANALMGAEYIKENRRVLRRKLGYDPDLLSVYLAHLLAPRRVALLSKIHPNTYMDKIYPYLATVNHELFYKPNGKPRTVAQFKMNLRNKLDFAYKSYAQVSTAAVKKFRESEWANLSVKENCVREIKYTVALVSKFANQLFDATTTIAMNKSNKTPTPQPKRKLPVFTADRRIA